MKTMSKRISQIFLCTMLLTAGCGGSDEGKRTPAEPETQITEAMTGDVYGQYEAAVSGRPQPESMTLTVTCSYDMYYSDDTMSAYDMDEVLQIENGDSPAAHLVQNIDSNGLRQTFDGYYYDGRLYNTYNGISYYEDMEPELLLESMLVPVAPAVIPESALSSVTGGRNAEGGTSYILRLADDGLVSYFTERYDRYGLDAFDGFQVRSGTVTVSFDEVGYFTGEEAVFDTDVTLSGQEVQVIYRSKVTVVDLNGTVVEISEEQKEAHAGYGSYQDIDTGSIETLTSDDDAAEETVTATFRKRLVSRLNYTEEEDGTYVSSFNNGNESYMVDFERHIFEYSNRTIHYIYNWKSDTGQMGACSLDFVTGVEGSECQDSTLEAIRDVKSWLEMELYYCGLTLKDLQAEAE